MVGAPPHAPLPSWLATRPATAVARAGAALPTWSQPATGVGGTLAHTPASATTVSPATASPATASPEAAVPATALPATAPPAAALAAGQRKRGRDPATAESVLATATRLGLAGPLGIDFDTEVGSSFGSSLLSAAHRRQALAWDLPRTATALAWLEPFMHASQRSPLFKPALGSGALAGQIWNRTTLDMLGEYIRTSPPLGKTKAGHVSAEAAQSYVGAIRLLRSREAKYDIAPEETNMWAPLAFRQMRREDGPPGDRALSRGIRLSTFGHAAAAGVDRQTGQGIVDWACALYCHDAYLRGGEPGVSDRAEPDPRRIITWGSFTWMDPCPESRSRPWLLGRVVPIKDVEARRGGYPTPTGRRHDGPFGADPTCTYDAMALAWWRRRAAAGTPFPVDAHGRPAPRWWEQCGGAARAASAPAGCAPFFTTADGRIYTTSAVRALAKRIAAAAHERCAEEPTAEEVGAKAFRVGGATDGRARLGERSADILKQRGRWESDVALIYQRPLLEEQLRLSSEAAPAAGRGLEDLCRGFAQAAVR